MNMTKGASVTPTICPKCSSPLQRAKPRRRHPSKAYWYEWYMKCRTCSFMYMPEDAKIPNPRRSQVKKNRQQQSGRIKIVVYHRGEPIDREVEAVPRVGETIFINGQSAPVAEVSHYLDEGGPEILVKTKDGMGDSETETER